MRLCRRIISRPKTVGALLLGGWIISFYLLLSSESSQPKSQIFPGVTLGLHIQPAKPLQPHIQDGGGFHDDVVDVCFTSDRNTIIGTMAAINSVHQNTRHTVRFHVIVESDIVEHVRQWLADSVLRDVDAEVIPFDTSLLEGKIKVRGGRAELAKPMNYARFLYPKLLPGVRGRVVHLDDDVIVQGDIAELAHVQFMTGQLASFAEDCVSASKRFSLFENSYRNFLNFNNEHIKKLSMSPQACSFNTGVFVTHLGSWEPMNITDRLLYWTTLNTKEDIYGNQKGGGGSQPPMMIVFYNQYAPMDPLWHIRHLGSSTQSKHYSADFIHKGKLLHWNGRQKPWSAFSAYQKIWNKYYVPDPSGKIKPVRQKHKHGDVP